LPLFENVLCNRDDGPNGTEICSLHIIKTAVLEGCGLYFVGSLNHKALHPSGCASTTFNLSAVLYIELIYFF